MAKSKRVTVGDVVKSKEGKLYIKVFGDHTLKSGQYLNFDTKAQLIDSLTEAVNAGKVKEETGEMILENLNKIPDYVEFRVSTSASED